MEVTKKESFNGFMIEFFMKRIIERKKNGIVSETVEQIKIPNYFLDFLFASCNKYDWWMASCKLFTINSFSWLGSLSGLYTIGSSIYIVCFFLETKTG